MKTRSALAAAEWKAVLALETKDGDSISCAGGAHVGIWSVWEEREGDCCYNLRGQNGGIIFCRQSGGFVWVMKKANGNGGFKTFLKYKLIY